MVGTFVYLLRAFIRSYGTREDAETAALVGVGVILVVITLFGLLYFAGAVVGSVRAPSVIRHVARETAASLESVYRAQRGAVVLAAQPGLPGGEPAFVVRADRDGTVTEIDRSALLGWATANDAVVVVTAGLGAHVSNEGDNASGWGTSIRF
jgi:uncharacterized membrane protein